MARNRRLVRALVVWSAIQSVAWSVVMAPVAAALEAMVDSIGSMAESVNVAVWISAVTSSKSLSSSRLRRAARGARRTGWEGRRLVCARWCG